MGRELTGPSGEARLRGGAGVALPRVPWSRPADARSAWDFLFQTATLQCARGLPATSAPKSLGLNALSSSWLEGQLFHPNYQPWIANNAAALMWAALRRYGDGQRKAPVFLVLGERAAEVTRPEDARVDHQVQFSRFAPGGHAGEDRVHFWNPQKLMRDIQMRRGQTVFGWTIEDSTRGFFSLDRAEFERQVASLDVPSHFPVPKEARGLFTNILKSQEEMFEKLRRQHEELMRVMRNIAQ